MNNTMSLEEKLLIVKAVMESGKCSITQFILEYNGTTYLTEETKDKTQPLEMFKSPKDAIMDYVGRIKPVIVEDYQPKYEEIWLRILELEEVKKDIYDRGRQQGTIFNRSLVANIIHLMTIDNMVVKGTNDARIAELLEPSKGKNHPVRNCLGLSPENRIKRAIEQLLIELGVKVCES